MGIQPDPDKTLVIQNMPAPKNVPELRRFLGMTNQMGKFSSQLGEMTQPLRELLSTNKAWVWGPSQEEAITKIKRELSRFTVLPLYDPAAGRHNPISGCLIIWARSSASPEN